MTGRTYQTVRIVYLALHHGIDSNEWCPGSLERGFVGFCGNVGVGCKEERLAATARFFLFCLIACRLNLLNIFAFVYSRQFFYSCSTWSQLYQPIALEPV